MKNEFENPEILKLLKEKLSKGNRELMLSIAEKMRAAVLKNFETEGARIGERWQRLSHATNKAKRKERILAWEDIEKDRAIETEHNFKSLRENSGSID